MGNCFGTSPATYELDVRAISMDNVSFKLPAVFTVGNKGERHHRDIVEAAVRRQTRLQTLELTMEEIFRATQKEDLANLVTERVQLDLRSWGIFVSDVSFGHLKTIPIAVPPSDIGDHLGAMLDSSAWTDVSFAVDGETFRAHRAVLAARSPVFRAELFGPMLEATTAAPITVHDAEPAVFKAMLRFIHKDALPDDDDELSSLEMLQGLLAAADRYALDRLKLLCAQKLVINNVTVDTVAAMLDCAETYSCPELKARCFDFLMVENNFMKATLTDGYVQLVQKYPWIVSELRKRIEP